MVTPAPPSIVTPELTVSSLPASTMAAALHSGREHDPVGSRGIGVCQGQRLAQAQHAVAGIDDVGVRVDSIDGHIIELLIFTLLLYRT